jgi:hypothetical protein
MTLDGGIYLPMGCAHKGDLPRVIVSPFRDFGSIFESYGFIFTIYGCISHFFCCGRIRDWRDAFADDRDRIWRANATAADRGTIARVGEEEIGEEGADKYLYRVDNTGRFVT